MLNSLTHSDIISLVAGSAKDHLVLTDFLIISYFILFLVGVGGGVIHKHILPIHSKQSGLTSACH